jgi:hypothetical protein
MVVVVTIVASAAAIVVTPTTVVVVVVCCLQNKQHPWCWQNLASSPLNILHGDKRYYTITV